MPLCPNQVLDLPFTASDGRTVRLHDFAGKVVRLRRDDAEPGDLPARHHDIRHNGSSRADRWTRSRRDLLVDHGRPRSRHTGSTCGLPGPVRTTPELAGTDRFSVDALWNYIGVSRERVGEPKGTPPRNWRTGRPLTYDVEHSDEVFFVDQRGHERFVLEGPPSATAGSVPDALRSFMNSAGKANLADPPATAWTQAQAQQVLRWLD